MNRAFYFVAGTAAGVYAAVRARRVAEAVSIDGLRDRVGAAVVGARMFRDEVAQGRADAETGLRERQRVALHEAEQRRALAAADTDQEESTV
jgi:translation elongation factor EF-Tu-like GTPase